LESTNTGPEEEKKRTQIPKNKVLVLRAAFSSPLSGRIPPNLLYLASVYLSGHPPKIIEKCIQKTCP